MMIEHIIYFENHGLRAGSSLVHGHTQLIGLSIVPCNVRTRIEEALLPEESAAFLRAVDEDGNQ